MNPFSQQWGSEDENSNSWPVGGQGPTFGALPTSTNLPCSMTFTFNMNDSSILNCSVIGSNSTTYFHITTNATTTTIARRSGDACAMVYWQQKAIIEAPGKIGRQRTSEWLKLTSDRRRRTMIHSGKTYSWIPRANSICLHSDDTNIAGELARITRTHTGVTLLLTIPAFNTGFFEPSVIATILLLSGRNID